MDDMFGGSGLQWYDWASIIFLLFVLARLIFACKDCFVLVPQGKAYIVERWGRYSQTIQAGLHFLTPVADRVAFVQDLREQTIPVPPQECFTSDNVKVLVDGVMYISVEDAHGASYGVTDYRFAAIQLAQTATRSVIGTIELDRTFEERDLISSRVVKDVNEAGTTWGIRVHRYEIKSISTPGTVRNAMEQQVTAEREGRALIARAEGDKQSRINRSEGRKLELINKSQGEMQAMINEAEGKAEEILAIAEATAQSIEKLADAITAPGGEESQRMQLFERYFKSLSSVARASTQVVLPANLTDFNALTNQLGISDELLTDDERQEAIRLREKRLKEEAAQRQAELAQIEASRGQRISEGVTPVPAAANAKAIPSAEQAALRALAATRTTPAATEAAHPADAAPMLPVSPISSEGSALVPVADAEGSGDGDSATGAKRLPPPPMRRRAPVV